MPRQNISGKNTQQTLVWPPVDRRTEVQKFLDEYKYFASQARVSALTAFRCALPISRRDQFDNGTPWSNHSKELMYNLDQECREGVRDTIQGLGQYKEALEKHNIERAQKNRQPIRINRDPVREWRASWAMRFSGLVKENISIVPDEWHHLQDPRIAHVYSIHAYNHGVESTLKVIKAQTSTSRNIPLLIEELNNYLQSQAKLSARASFRCIVPVSNRDAVDKAEGWNYPNAEYNTDVLMYDRDSVARTNARQCVDELSDLGQDSAKSHQLWRKCWEVSLAQALAKHEEAVPLSQQLRQWQIAADVSNIAWEKGTKDAVQAVHLLLMTRTANYAPLKPTVIWQKTSNTETTDSAHRATGNDRGSSMSRR